jgi:hypothetical protein
VRGPPRRLRSGPSRQSMTTPRVCCCRRSSTRRRTSFRAFRS